MLFRLIALMLCPLAFSTSGAAMVGLLDPMSQDLGVPVEMVGQLQSAFAVACGLSGPLIARLTVNMDKKRMLMAVLASLILINLLSAFAGRYDTLLIIRAAGGILASLTLPLASALVFGLAEPQKRASALAFVISGNTIALLIGIPLASILGASFGWPIAFLFAGLLAMVALAMVTIIIPHEQGAETNPGDAFKMALARRCLPVYACTFLGFSALFSVSSFIGPVITTASGVTGAGIGALQALVGIGGIIGLSIGARLAGRGGRNPVMALFSFLFISLCLFSITMTLNMGQFDLVLLSVAIPMGSASLFALAPILQTRLAEATGSAIGVALSINASMLFLGQGMGAVIGGLVTYHTALNWIGLGGAVVALMGAVFALLYLPQTEAEAPTLAVS